METNSEFARQKGKKMACYNTRIGYYSKEINKTGKRSLVFDIKYAIDDQQVEIPCGTCMGCRVNKKSQWALRIMHEAMLHEENCFITLTYTDEELSNRKNPHTLNKSDGQKFIKRLRNKIKADTPKGEEVKKILYYMAYEYGDETMRPHMHAIIFNHNFNDKEIWSEKDDNKLYTSKELDEIWGMGMCTIGAVTKDTATYTAGYTTKKITGEMAKEHYKVADENGEIFEIIPECATMSTRPAIGKNWFIKFQNDLEKDYITHKGVKYGIPAYYDKLKTKEDPINMDDVKEKREMNMRTPQFLRENTHERKRVKEKVQELKRKNYEDNKKIKI